MSFLRVRHVSWDEGLRSGSEASLLNGLEVEARKTHYLLV